MDPEIKSELIKAAECFVIFHQLLAELCDWLFVSEMHPGSRSWLLCRLLVAFYQRRRYFRTQLLMFSFGDSCSYWSKLSPNIIDDKHEWDFYCRNQESEISPESSRVFTVTVWSQQHLVDIRGTDSEAADWLNILVVSCFSDLWKQQGDGDVRRTENQTLRHQPCGAQVDSPQHHIQVEISVSPESLQSLSKHSKQQQNAA